MIIFDLIKSLFKYCFRLELYYFNPAVHTKLFKILVRQIDKWYIRGSRGDTFQIIIFDLINSIFKFWSRFKTFCFNYDVCDRLIKNLVKGCRIFKKGLLLYKEFWWKLDWYLIDNLSRFWKPQFYELRGTSYFSIYYDC